MFCFIYVIMWAVLGSSALLSNSNVPTFYNNKSRNSQYCSITLTFLGVGWFSVLLGDEWKVFFVSVPSVERLVWDMLRLVHMVFQSSRLMHVDTAVPQLKVCLHVSNLFSSILCAAKTWVICAAQLCPNTSCADAEGGLELLLRC